MNREIQLALLGFADLEKQEALLGAIKDLPVINKEDKFKPLRGKKLKNEVHERILSDKKCIKIKFQEEEQKIFISEVLPAC